MANTMKDMKEMKRILNAERACKNALTDWGKNFWYNTFKKLCEKYGKMAYFNQVRGD
tara:strand:- start:46 stop:216 length:171 start_codon:yes stop_codon:yes gene_type:complete